MAETAAVAVQPQAGGPSRLVIFAALFEGHEFAEGELLRTLQDAIRRRLNPLFRIHEVVQVAALPRTASNKTMRRVLRASYAAPGGTS